MPKEKIGVPDDVFFPQVGWRPEMHLQLGIGTSKESLIRTVLGDDPEKLRRIGKRLRERVGVQVYNLPDVELGQFIVDSLDDPGEESPGVWCSLDRPATNRLIRVLRRARNSAFGEDA